MIARCSKVEYRRKGSILKWNIYRHFIAHLLRMAVSPLDAVFPALRAKDEVEIRLLSLCEQLVFWKESFAHGKVKRRMMLEAERNVCDMRRI